MDERTQNRAILVPIWALFLYKNCIFSLKIELHLFLIDQSYATFKGDDVHAIECIIRCHIHREMY